MSFALTRMFAYFTVVSYLVVGAVAVRVLAPEMTTIEISTSYSKLLSKTEFETTEAEPVVAPVMVFDDIKMPVVKKAVAAIKKPVVIAKPVVVAKAEVKAPEMRIETVAKNELPFYEPVVLSKITLNNELETNLVALYQDFKYDAVAAAAAPVADEVSTKLAATEEPEFFEYPEVKEVRAERKAEPTKVVTKTEVKEEIVEENLSDMIAEEPMAAESPVVEVAKTSASVQAAQADEDLVAFDYSKAKSDIKSNTMPTVSTVTTHSVGVPVAPAGLPTVDLRGVQTPKSHKSQKPVTTQTEKNKLVEKTYKKEESFVPATYPTSVTIQVSATDLKKTVEEANFEVRFQDDLSGAVQDYGSGSVTIDETLSQPKMTRSVTVLKRGFAPTNTDLILEDEGANVSLPLIEENTFNELLAPFEARGPMGAVLVELEDNVEGATLDVPYSQVLKLNEEMQVTNDNVFAYQLFVGVKAGNALLSYKDGRGVTSKIIHIHERELTFEANFFEEVRNERVVLLEEDLLGKEKTPLIVSAEEVKEFATNKTAKKINNHTHETDFGRTLLGGRKYLELTHQREPVFVGYKENNQVEIPSENFMRYILSQFENNKLGNRCLVQLNLSKKAIKVDVGAESVGANLMTSTQILDADGKFYESVGAKSRKVIVVGENQGPDEYSQDAKINFKVTYEDGSVQYLGSYCSPNTYLVEQL